MDILGSQLYKQIYTNLNGNIVNEIDVSTLPIGNYLLKIKTKEGAFVRKISIY
jgi:hypothetical protein